MIDSRGLQAQFSLQIHSLECDHLVMALLRRSLPLAARLSAPSHTASQALGAGLVSLQQAYRDAPYAFRPSKGFAAVPYDPSTPFAPRSTPMNTVLRIVPQQTGETRVCEDPRLTCAEHVSAAGAASSPRLLISFAMRKGCMCSLNSYEVQHLV